MIELVLRGVAIVLTIGLVGAILNHYDGGPKGGPYAI